MDKRFVDQSQSKVNFRAGNDGAGKTITGYAAVYYDGTPGTEFRLWDGAVERIMHGAFDESLTNGDDVMALFNHERNNILGRSTSGTLKLTSDKIGLKYEIKPGDTSISRDVIEHITRGDLKGSSFAFDITEELWTAGKEFDIREVRSVKLLDVGPVTFPAYEATTSNVRDKSSWDKWKAKNENDKNAENACKAEIFRLETLELTVVD